MEESRQAVAEAKRQADTAQTTLNVSDRAWIKIDSASIDKLQFQNDQVSIWATFHLKNVGHSPALRVGVFPRLLIQETEPWAFKEVRALCDDIRNTPALVHGGVIFPDDTSSVTINFGRPKKEIDQARETEISRDFQAWKQSFGEKEASQVANPRNPMYRFSSFALIACASYRLASDSSIHQTSLIFTLSRDPDHPDIQTDVRSGEVDTTKIGSILGSDLKLTPQSEGTFAD